MNENNNIIGYDSQTGQPIYGSQNINMQQPIQTQINTGYAQQQTQPPKKSKKGLAIVVVLVIIAVIVGIVLFGNQDKKGSTNNDTPNNPKVENNNNQNNKQQNNNSTGRVEEGTNTNYDENGAFLFSIEDVFTIINRGTLVTGDVQRGKVKVGDIVQIIGLSKEILTTEVMEVQLTRNKIIDEATVGDSIGILLKDITKDQVQRGQVLAKPNSIKAAIKFDANVHILTKEEGGKQTPIFNGHRTQFYFDPADVTGVIDFPDNVKMMNPNDDGSITVILESSVAMEVGTKFSIREDGRMIGKGTVTKVY